MIVGTVTVDVNLPGVSSLKEKRRRIKSLLARVKNQFGVSIAEVDYNDSWRRAQLGVAVVSNERKHADQVIAGVMRMIEAEPEMVVVDYDVEML
ncbi:MAG: DUF503 domain-containing protein [candidate division Zixibacteria bacterium]|nr:DUF503 domain-containing protein [candidate division Zixibacteria bacterium]